jgi:hypothetical protein
MHAQFISRLALIVLSLFSLLVTLPSATVAASAAKEECQCVAYVVEQYNLTQSAHAKDMAEILIKAGFTRLAGPANNAVVIISPKGFTSGDGAIYGHIAVVVSYTIEGSKVRLVLRGTNQYAPGYSEDLPDSARCSNVVQTRYAAIESEHLAFFQPKQEQVRQPTNGDTVVIRSVHSNMVVDVKGKKTGNSTVVQQHPANNGDNQRFRLVRVSGDWYTLRPRHASNMCLDVKGRAGHNGAEVQIYRCHSGTNQQFRFVHRGNGRFALIARHSDAALDVTHWSTAKGQPLQMWRQHADQQNQQWTLEFK